LGRKGLAAHLAPIASLPKLALHDFGKINGALPLWCHKIFRKMQTDFGFNQIHERRQIGAQHRTQIQAEPARFPYQDGLWGAKNKT
jgi:hypothetical protein